MSTSSLYSIEKLDGSNYASWCVHMKSILVHSDYWGLVSGRIKRDPDALPEDLSIFDVKDEKALASIMLCIKPSQINHVRHCKTASEAWEKLRGIYQPSGPVHKVTLFKKLLYKKISNSDSVEASINEFCDTVEKLAEIGVEVPDELLVIILLSSLPESYENFVVAIETRDHLPLLHTLKLKILEEEIRRQERDENYDSHHAFVARSKNSTESNRSSNNKNDSKYNRNSGTSNSTNNNNFNGKC